MPTCLKALIREWNVFLLQILKLATRDSCSTMVPTVVTSPTLHLCSIEAEEFSKLFLLKVKSQEGLRYILYIN